MHSAGSLLRAAEHWLAATGWGQPAIDAMVSSPCFPNTSKPWQHSAVQWIKPAPHPTQVAEQGGMVLPPRQWPDNQATPQYAAKQQQHMLLSGQHQYCQSESASVYLCADRHGPLMAVAAVPVQACPTLCNSEPAAFPLAPPPPPAMPARQKKKRT